MRNEPVIIAAHGPTFQIMKSQLTQRCVYIKLPCALTLAGFPSPISNVVSSEIFSEENDLAVCFFFIPVVENTEQD